MDSKKPCELEEATKVLIEKAFGSESCCKCQQPAQRLVSRRFYCQNCLFNQGRIDEESCTRNLSPYEPRIYRCIQARESKDQDLIKDLIYHSNQRWNWT